MKLTNICPTAQVHRRGCFQRRMTEIEVLKAGGLYLRGVFGLGGEGDQDRKCQGPGETHDGVTL